MPELLAEVPEPRDAVGLRQLDQRCLLETLGISARRDLRAQLSDHGEMAEADPALADRRHRQRQRVEVLAHPQPIGDVAAAHPALVADLLVGRDPVFGTVLRSLERLRQRGEVELDEVDRVAHTLQVVDDARCAVACC